MTKPTITLTVGTGRGTTIRQGALRVVGGNTG